MKARSSLETETTAAASVLRRGRGRADAGTGIRPLLSSSHSDDGGADIGGGIGIGPRRLDEDEALLRTATSPRDRSETDGDPDVIGHGASRHAQEHDPDRATSPEGQLPVSLRILFACNGITLALPSTALMYIVNTRIAMPLSVLPAYASVAFLPFSLKPLYAVANHCLLQPAPPTATATSSKSRRSSHGHVLLSALLLLNSATIIGTYYYARDVPSCFVWAFVRGVTSAWAEFLLGLALLSHVRVERQGAQERQVEAALHGTDDGTAGASGASFRASRFQAEAAAARGAGSLLSYVFAAAYFGLSAAAAAKEAVSSRNERSISEADVWYLLAVAGLVHVAGSALALASRVGSSEAEPPEPNREEEGPLSSSHGLHRGCLGRTQALVSAAAAELTTRGRDPSYSRVGAGLDSDRNADEADNTEAEATTVEADRPPLGTATSSSSFSVAATLMIGSLQVALVLLTVREPIVGATSAGAWWCGWIACVVALVGSAMYYSAPSDGESGTARRSRHSNANTATTICHRVGLFLALRHAVPNCGYLVGSYVYALLEDHPVVLQVLAVHGSAVTTVAAWSYGRFGEPSFSSPANAESSPRDDPRRAHHPLGHCHAVIPVIVITTVAASVLSLTQLSYLYYVVPPPMVNIIVPQLGVIFVVKSLTTLADEWKFLPDVVLATLAAVEGEQESEASPEVETRDADTASDCSLPSRDGQANLEARGSGSDSLERDLKYGSLVSCIDFGEQLGSLLTGPLVAALHVTRDGAQGRWVHFDRLIIVGALLSVMSLLLLLILPGVNVSTIVRVRFPSWGSTNRHG
jgi:hypothetical protein